MIKTEGYRKEWKAMKGNLILIHGGGPTAVINASLAGAIRQAKKEPNVDRILAAIGGTGGLMRGQVRDLTDITEEELALLERTPGSAIGTSRDALEEPEYRLLAEKCVELGAKYVLMNGGNGTMDACGKLCRMLAGTDIRVMGIPKTMDNDIAVTDHAPGFGSAARYIAQSVAEVTADVRGLPIHVVVIEASGRNAGWITAASALARQAGVDGPDLIYLPERPFDEAQYLRDVQKLIEEKHGVVVVASEGLKDKDGKPIVEPVFKVGRASIALSSDVDRREAILAGEEAVRAACAGENGKMVGFIRESTSPYRARTTLIDVNDVMLVEKKMPDEYINEAGNGVTQAFLDWCAPLIGEPLGKLISLR